MHKRMLLCACALTAATRADPLQRDALCPVPAGLDGQKTAQRVEWFRARHQGEACTVRACVWQRLPGERDEIVAGQVWRDGHRLAPSPDTEERDLKLFVPELPPLSGERWLALTAQTEPLKPGPSSLYYLHPEVAEVYTYRDGGDTDDQLELLESSRGGGDYSLRVWMPAESRWTRPAQSGSLSGYPGEHWQELAVDEEWRAVAADPDQIVKEAEEKLRHYPSYHFAAQMAGQQTGVHDRR